MSQSDSFNSAPQSSLPPRRAVMPPGQFNVPYAPARSGFGSFFGGCALGCSGCLLPCLLLLFVLGAACGTPFSLSDTVERKVLAGPEATLDNASQPKIAVIRIEDSIMDTDGFINDQITDVMKDSSVKAIVLRLDTPGGSVSASDYFFHKLSELRKDKKIPIVVSMGGVCASGGYYIAMACGTENENVIFAEPTTWTGSIGVIISNYDISELAGKVGVKEDSIKSHELKGIGSLGRSLTEKERAILQGLVDDAFARFKEVVYAGRKKFAENPDALVPLATGEVFTTKKAIAAGLVDKEGYLDEAVSRAAELAGLDYDSVQVYTYNPIQTLSSLMRVSQEKLVQSPVSEMRESLSPRACYLWQVGN